MLIVETIARIRREHLGKGVAIKQIARELRLSRNTVRKVVRSDETSFRYERRVQPLPKLGPWVEELERRLEANEGEKKRDRLSLLRIFEAVAELGYRGGYDAVRRSPITRRRTGYPSTRFYALFLAAGRPPLRRNPVDLVKTCRKQISRSGRNIHKYLILWCRWADSNRRPTDYESVQDQLPTN